MIHDERPAIKGRQIKNSRQTTKGKVVFTHPSVNFEETDHINSGLFRAMYKQDIVLNELRAALSNF